MPNPKRRHSKSRTRQRRAHDALKMPQFYIDKDTGEAEKTAPHRCRQPECTKVARSSKSKNRNKLICDFRLPILGRRRNKFLFRPKI